MEWTDDYAWLRADDWQACVRDPERLPAGIAEHLEAENAYCDAAFRGTERLRATLLAEMRGRIEEEDESLPSPDGDFEYLTRYRDGDEYATYLRRTRGGGAEAVLLDVNVEAEGHEYFDEGAVEHSPDHRHLAWTSDTDGAEYYTLRVRRIEGGGEVGGQDPGEGTGDLDTIEDVGDACWADATTLLYTRVDEHHRPSRVFRHVLGTSAAEDALVLHEADPRFFLSVGTSLSRDYVFIESSSDDTSETLCLRADATHEAPFVIAPRREGHEYDVDHQRDPRGGPGSGRFLILTNAGDAIDFKLVETPVASPGETHWRDLVAHREGRLLLHHEATATRLFWLERENALPRLCWLDTVPDETVSEKSGAPRSSAAHHLEFDEEAYALGFDIGLEYAVDVIRVDYASPTTPERTFELDLRSGARSLVKEQRIPSGHDPDDYVVRRRFARSADGSEVPVTLLHRRDTPIDGTAPCLVYGYGAYGASIPADFSGTRLSLVDRGFVYAIAHVRGGQEKGRAWYEAAKREGKPKSFEDLLAVALDLVATGYARRGSVVLHGASGGGLLVAATANLAVEREPGLLGGVIADVPFVDVLATLLDADLPLTPGEWRQWGNPVESAAAFAAIRSWSPVENVRAAIYPPIYATAGVSDPRVTWWEPAKWVATLRARAAGDAPVLLRTHMHSGHFGETGRFASLEDAVREQAFAIAIATPDR